MTLNEFESRVIPVIIEEATKRGYKFPSAIVAQAICESGILKGGSTLSNRYFNFWGMKCGSGYKGKSVNLTTKEEYTAGTLTTIKDNFRSFSNIREGVEGYFLFIQKTRYQNLKEATSPEDYIQKLKADGWATSSTYVNTLTNILNKYNLKKYDNIELGEVIMNEDKQLNTDKEVVKIFSKFLQEILNKYGFELQVDGIIGPKTFEALNQFRRK